MQRSPLFRVPYSGLDVSGFPRHELTVRNRREPLVIRTIDDVQALVPAGVESRPA